MLTKEQAEEIIKLIQGGTPRMPEVFDKISSYNINTTEIANFKAEFTSGRYFSDFEVRMQVYINEIAKTKFKIEPPKSYNIFFSFSSVDIEEATNYVQKLRKSGLSVFFSDDELKKSAGNYVDKINHALKNSDCFVLHCTPNSYISEWVKDEYQIFYHKIHKLNRIKKPFFVLKGKDYNDDLIPFDVSITQAHIFDDILKIFGKISPEEEKIQKLNADIKQLQHENDILEENNKQSIEKYTRLENKNIIFNRNIISLESKIEDLQDKKHQLEEKIIIQKEQIEKLKTQTQNTEQITTLNQKIKENETQILQFKNEIEKLKQQIDNQNRLITEKTTTIKSLNEKINGLESNITIYKKQLEQNNQNTQQIDTLNQKIKEKNNEIEKIKQDISKKIQETNNQNRLLTDKESIIKTLNQKITTLESERNTAKTAVNCPNCQKLWKIPLYKSIKFTCDNCQTLCYAENGIINKHETPITDNNMVLIKGGTFLMGSPESEVDRENDEKQHSVSVSSFYMSKYELTVEEYEKYCSATKTKMPDAPDFNPNWKNKRHPIVNVSWEDAIAYCAWLSKTTGKTYRLPTEAEWEYACRAGTTTPFFTGANLTTSQANYHGDYPYNGNAKGIFRGGTTEVGSFPPNAWGLYDMHGNVWEWCQDYYTADYNGTKE
ncbi:MAG: TIR domain-containing protein, partial [Cytophagia bacterium]